MIEVTGGLYLLLVRMIGTHQLVGCWMALLETNNRISCAPIMQSLPSLMTQAKTFLIYHNKAVEVTGALYWLLVRRIGTHRAPACWLLDGFETDICISCQLIVQSLQAKTHWIHNSKTVEVTRALY